MDSAVSFGMEYLPDCTEKWRTAGPCAENITKYAQNLDAVFSEEKLRSLAREGDILIRQCGGLYPALAAFQESEMRAPNEQLDFAHEHALLFPAQYPAVTDILIQGVTAVYNRGVGVAPRVRGLPYNMTSPDQTLLIASKLWKDIAHRRIFVCSAAVVGEDSPIEATPTTTVEKKNPDRTISADRRVIAGMRRINVGFNPEQYYPIRAPTVESIARLLVALTTLFPGWDIQMAKRDIASAFRLIRLHPSLSLLMCAELPGVSLGHSHDAILLYMVMPFGWNGAPANFAIMGDAISRIHARFGMGRPDWFLPFPSLSKLYVDDGLLFEARGAIRQRAHVLTWETITIGLLGRQAINLDKLEEEGRWSDSHTMLGFDINSNLLTISLPDAKITGARALFEKLFETRRCRALEVITLQQIRGHVEHFKAPNSLWKFLTGPIGLLLGYTDETAVWVNCPVPEVWVAFWDSMGVVFEQLASDAQWHKMFRGTLIRLLTPEQRLSVHLNRISPRFPSGAFTWVSLDATLSTLGGLSWGDREFFRSPASGVLSPLRKGSGGAPIISECELVAALIGIFLWSRPGRHVLLCTDNQNVLNWVSHAKSYSPVENRILRTLNLFCLNNCIDVLPAYVRSEHNIIADGLARWSTEETKRWSVSESMTQVEPTAQLWTDMALPYDPTDESASLPNTFALLSSVLHFYKSHNYKICEWRPGHYAVAGVLENWGVPVFSDQVMNPELHEHLSRRVAQPFREIQTDDIFLLVGLCTSAYEIQDFRRTASQRSVRYAAMVAPFGLSDPTHSDLWGSRTALDSALTGDPPAGTWIIYASGGIQSHHFDLGPRNSEIRTLNECYPLAGMECQEDPTGVPRTHQIPNSVGRLTTISADGYDQYSRFSHLPLFNSTTFAGGPISWPYCVDTNDQPSLAQNWSLQADMLES